MRLWIINHYALPPTNAGGTRHYNFAKQLIQRGHDVTIIAANYNHNSHTYIQTISKTGETDHTYDVPFVWIPTPSYKGNTIARFWNMLVFSRRLLQKKYFASLPPPDVIIGSSPHLFSAFSAEILAKRFNVPYLLEIRDIWPDTLVELGRISSKHPLIKLMKHIELRLYKRATRVISLLPSADQYFVQHGVDPENILWLPNAVDAETVPDNLIREPNQKFTIMYAGAHGLANDLDTLLDAAKILQNKKMSDHIRICLLGDGPDKNRLKDRVSHENINIIEFIDSVPKKDVYTILNKADVFVMLLKESPIFRWGISPNKLFDYLMMARPVIFGVNTPFNPVKEYNAGVSINPSDPEALAVAISKLFSLPKDELTSMGLRGKDFVIKNHSFNHLTESLESLIHNAIYN